MRERSARYIYWTSHHTETTIKTVCWTSIQLSYTQSYYPKYCLQASIKLSATITFQEVLLQEGIPI